MPGIMSMIARTPAMPPVELMVGRADEVAAWVMRGTADVGLNESLPGHTQFRYWEVFSDTLILCAAASHANTSPMLLDWVGIEEIGTIVWETETDLERFVIDAFHTHQLYVKRLREDSFRLTSSAAVLSVIESGAWAGFVTESLARSRLAAGQLIKLGDFDIPVKYWLFSPRHQENQSLAAAIAKAAGQLRGLYSRADQTEPEASLPAVPLSMD
jgi:DNA-binding transcriptional LysR family regulator